MPAKPSTCSSRSEFPFSALIQFFGLFLIAEALLRYYDAPLPWTTGHAPLIGQLLMKRFKVLSHGGVSAITRRVMTENEKRAYAARSRPTRIQSR